MATIAERVGGSPADSVRLRRLLAVVTIGLLVSASASAFLRQGATVVTVDDAVSAFRSASPSSTSTTSVAAPVAPAAAPTESTAVSAPPPAGLQPSSAKAEPARTTAPAAAQPSAGAPAATAAAAPSVEEGVYTYATEGYEYTNALGGARHEYPAETPVTLRRLECGGWVQRWQPLAERWDESELCPDAGGDAIAVRRFTTHHEFFQRSQRQDFTCPPTAHVYRRSAAAGQQWAWECAAGGSGISTTVTFLGVEPLRIAGADRPAAHILYESTLTGANRGTQRQERWLDPETGLNLQIKTDIDTEADSPFGAVHYEEHYVITLSSTEPRR